MRACSPEPVPSATKAWCEHDRVHPPQKLNFRGGPPRPPDPMFDGGPKCASKTFQHCVWGARGAGLVGFSEVSFCGGGTRHWPQADFSFCGNQSWSLLRTPLFASRGGSPPGCLSHSSRPADHLSVQLRCDGRGKGGRGEGGREVVFLKNPGRAGANTYPDRGASLFLVPEVYPPPADLVRTCLRARPPTADLGRTCLAGAKLSVAPSRLSGPNLSQWCPLSRSPAPSPVSGLRPRARSLASSLAYGLQPPARSPASGPEPDRWPPGFELGLDKGRPQTILFYSVTLRNACVTLA